MGRILFFASLAVQAYCYWHASTRMTCCADRWMLYVIAIPIIGPILYFVLVYLPSELSHRQKSTLKRSLADIFNPNRQLNNRRALYEQTPTAFNAQRLAEVLIAKGLYAEAEPLLHSVLAMPHDVESSTYELLSQAQRGQGNLQGARASCHKAIELADSPARRADLLLQEGEICTDLGDTATAIQRFEEALPHAAGEKVRVCLAQSYAAQGQMDKAQQMLAEIAKRTKNAPVHYRSAQAEWIKASRQLEQTLAADTTNAALQGQSR